MGSLAHEAGGGVVAGVPPDARERSIWVQGRLRLHASSFAAIARRLGISARAVGQAMYAPNIRAEIAIAAAIGMEQRLLFAERYGSDGARLHSIRPVRPAGPAPTTGSDGGGA